MLFSPYVAGDKRLNLFFKDIILKMKVVARLEFELVYFEAVAEHFSH